MSNSGNMRLVIAIFDGMSCFLDSRRGRVVAVGGASRKGARWPEFDMDQVTLDDLRTGNKVL